ncbi:uncharacterized protein urp1 isoform X2 [Electrophorus electricus]|uniref:uncharacterized protein urp1 isoform X2 n=1 Tax=Electrophorus electricus TaxID=8005 RepID=UPI0015D00AB8|nr:uncharacterized protein urp1 isoform X2 [Electrophorus electricus]
MTRVPSRQNHLHSDGLTQAILIHPGWMALEGIKPTWSSRRTVADTPVSEGLLIMRSGALLYILAVAFSAVRALPLLSDSALTPQEELFQKLVAEVEVRQKDDLNEQGEIQNIFPVLLQQERDTGSWPIGAKEPLQQEKRTRVGEVLKAALMKLGAADKLRSQGFLRTEQNLPKPNKRACFWKYCVTN